MCVIVVVKAHCPVQDTDREDFAIGGRGGQVAVDRSTAYAWVTLYDMGIDHLGRWMIAELGYCIEDDLSLYRVPFQLTFAPFNLLIFCII